jgi:3',5'-cyclic AMP phosphodiesterase CpdA
MILILGCASARNGGTGPEDRGRFDFVFMTDIHVQPELDAEEGFSMAVDRVNRLSPDFVITGGDLVMDVLGVTYGRADSLYRIYEKLSAGIDAPLYNTIGNHEIYGWYEESGADPSHPEFGKKMYRKRLGRTYYSFDYGGWHFLVLDSVEREGDRGYVGKVGKDQLEWIRRDLSGVQVDTPIAVCTHIPLVSVMPQLREGPGTGISPSEVITNSREVLELFAEHNLKLVLQGHLHLVEEIRVSGVTFITAGAVSGRWWKGPRRGIEEGFAFITVNGGDFDWKYINYGWEAEQ